MIFTEVGFLFFFALCFAVHWLIGGHRGRKIWLLASSYAFYAFWDWRFVSLIILSTVVDYAVGLKLYSNTGKRRRAWLITSLCANLGLLGFFKYYNFFVTSGSQLLDVFGYEAPARTLEIILPVGISFFTFQTMSYTIDIYRGKLEPTRDLLDFALFVGFFPQLVAGPIVRARQFLPQLAVPRRFASIRGRQMLLLFLSGFVKKACIADNIARVIDPVFSAPSQFSGADLGLASALYSVQIYCDFSGYTDMAIAVAGLLGYELTKNFEFPFFSTNVQEFWRRWHISLSSWLRDYLYISMGGGRGSRMSVVRNLMATMLLGGLWHGANMTFVVWGGLHGAALLLHRAWRARTRFRTEPGGVPIGQPTLRRRIITVGSVALTLTWTVGCFALFRCPSMVEAGDLFGGLLDWSGPTSLNNDWWFLICVLGFCHLCLYRLGQPLSTLAASAHAPVFYFGYGVMCALIPLFLPGNSEPFIYFQF